jgi:two-component system, NarL family, nitrate/nitrite response regulator NarL
MRLVLCDEQEMFVDSLAFALDQVGHRIAAVVTGPEALVAAVRATSPDVCVLGVVYGDRVLVELPGAVRRASPDTAVVVLTGHQDPRLWEAYAEGSADALLGKGCSLETIDQTLRLVAAGGRQVVGWRRSGARRRRPDVMLTPRESDVVRMLVRGSSTEEMAQTLTISPNTLRTHVQHLMDKLGAHSRVEVVRMALDRSLLDVDAGV